MNPGFALEFPIKAVIKILPSKIKLTLDANQGYAFTKAE